MAGWDCMIKSRNSSWIPKHPDLNLERAYWHLGVESIGGIDEAGRGAWAGPVAASIVILPQGEEVVKSLSGVRDSKQMTPAERSQWAEQIKSVATAWQVGFASQLEIDKIGILQATRLAAKRAIDSLHLQPQFLLIDWLYLPEVALPQMAIIKGDNRSLSIASASVLAKTARDAFMVEQNAVYPVYGFAAHKGYGTAAHQRALREYGPCSIHRMSFKPLKELKRE